MTGARYRNITTLIHKFQQATQLRKTMAAGGVGGGVKKFFFLIFFFGVYRVPTAEYTPHSTN